MRPSLISFSELRQWLSVATPLARDIVRSVINEEKGGIHVHNIFEKTQAYTLSEKQMQEQRGLFSRLLRRIEGKEVHSPPNPLHPIRSLTYLKRVVMADLEIRGEVVQEHKERAPTEEELANRPRPFTRKQRKLRGGVGPGKQPPLIKDDVVHEWLWRLTTEEERQKLRDNEKEWRKRLEKIKILEKDEKEAMNDPENYLGLTKVPVLLRGRPEERKSPFRKEPRRAMLHPGFGIKSHFVHERRNESPRQLPKIGPYRPSIPTMQEPDTSKGFYRPPILGSRNSNS